MEENPNYYAIIPAEVRYDNSLSDREKLLYGEITCLCNITGKCWATNEYFANLYNVSISSIKRSILNLVKNNYINREIFYKKDSKEIEKRIITLCSNLHLPSGQICTYPQVKNEPDNITSNNITSINNKERNIKERNTFNQEEIVDEYLSKKFVSTRDIVLWKEIILKWLKYKKEEFRDVYKTPTTLNTFMINLFKYSNNGYETARKIIDTSITNRYKGIFEPKKNREVNKHEYY